MGWIWLGCFRVFFFPANKIWNDEGKSENRENFGCFVGVFVFLFMIV